MFRPCKSMNCIKATDGLRSTLHFVSDNTLSERSVDMADKGKTNCVFWVKCCSVKFKKNLQSQDRKQLRALSGNSHSRVHLNKWACVILFGIFSGKLLIALCFFLRSILLSKRSCSNHIKRLGLVLRLRLCRHFS